MKTRIALALSALALLAATTQPVQAGFTSISAAMQPFVNSASLQAARVLLLGAGLQKGSVLVWNGADLDHQELGNGQALVGNSNSPNGVGARAMPGFVAFVLVPSDGNGQVVISQGFPSKILLDAQCQKVIVQDHSIVPNSLQIKEPSNGQFNVHVYAGNIDGNTGDVVISPNQCLNLDWCQDASTWIEN